MVVAYILHVQYNNSAPFRHTSIILFLSYYNGKIIQKNLDFIMLTSWFLLSYLPLVFSELDICVDVVSESIFRMDSAFLLRLSCSSLEISGVDSGTYLSGIRILPGVPRILSIVSDVYFTSDLERVERTTSGVFSLGRRARSMSRSSLEPP